MSNAQNNGSATIKSADEPDKPQTALDLASDLLRAGQAMSVSDRIKGQRYLDALLNAETKLAYGDAFKAPEGEPVVAIDSKFETHHHAAPVAPAAQAPQPKPLPAWIPVAAIVAAVAGAGAGGAWLNQALTKPEAAATSPAPDGKDYSLGFWDEEPAK